MPADPSPYPAFTPGWTRNVRVLASDALRNLAASLGVAITVGSCVASDDGGFATFRVSFLEKGPDGAPSPRAIENELSVDL